MPVAQRHVIIIILVLDLHQRDCLLQLLERVHEHGRIVETVDKLDEEFDVFGDGGDAVGVDGLDFREKREGEDALGGVGESVEVDEFFDRRGEAEEGGVHDVGEVTCQSLHVAAWFFDGSNGHPVSFVLASCSSEKSLLWLGKSVFEPTSHIPQCQSSRQSWS